MAWRHIVNQIIQNEKQEIELYRRIAAGAPTECLRNMIMEMAEHEKEELKYWQDMLGKYDCPPGYYPGNPHQPGQNPGLK